jgi:hypothetical protein
MRSKKSIYKKGFEHVETVPISFEFFPTKTDAGAEKLKVVHQELQLLNPEFSQLLMVLVVLPVNVPCSHC